MVAALLSLLLTLVLAGLVFYCFWWALGALGLPDPFNTVLRVLIVVFALIAVIAIILDGYRIPLAGLPTH